TGTALVTGGISANPQDILAFRPSTQTSLGAATAGTWNRFFVGNSNGLNNPTLHNIDALFYQRDPVSPFNKPSLLISTAGNFPVSGGGSNADIAQFNASSGGPSGLLSGSFAPDVALRASNFGHAGANVTGFWQGTTPTDPNPFGNPVSPPVFPTTLGSGGAFAASFVSDSATPAAQLAQALPSSKSTAATAPAPVAAAAPVVNSSLSAKVAQAVAGNKTTSTSVKEQADSFFANSKRTRSSAVASLAKNLLARFK
ncbi:MAG TPA: hypothetical protein PKA06_00815, partial [Gemmatales bacterium]|nr:hypothetical protein [Gemmatales bacterium]